MNINVFGTIYKGYRFDNESLNAESCQTADSTEFVNESHIKRTGIERFINKNLQEKPKTKKCGFLKINYALFLFAVHLCAFLVPTWILQVIFRPFNSGSFNVQTDNVLSAVWRSYYWNQIPELAVTVSKRRASPVPKIAQDRSFIFPDISIF